MTGGIGIAPAGLPLVAVLALLGTLLFALAAWRGRWSLWVGGYLVVIVALVVAFIARAPARSEARDGHRSPASGVVDYAGSDPGPVAGWTCTDGNRAWNERSGGGSGA